MSGEVDGGSYLPELPQERVDSPISGRKLAQGEGGSLRVVANGESLAGGQRELGGDEAAGRPHDCDRGLQRGDAEFEEPMRVRIRAVRDVAQGADNRSEWSPND